MSNPKFYKRDEGPTIRSGQVITNFGIGSIVLLPNSSSVMLCDDIKKWSDKKNLNKLYDERLANNLNVDHFYMLPGTETSKEGLLAVRFPRQLRCRKCKVLADIGFWKKQADQSHSKRNFNTQPFCYKDKSDLIHFGFVVACRKGHIDDFPGKAWVHDGAECPSEELKYQDTERVGAGGIILKCKVCPRSKGMQGAYNKNALSSVASCSGNKPWLDVRKRTKQCGEGLSVLQRAGTNVYFPVVKSSILIPPHTSTPTKIEAKIRDTGGWRSYNSQEGAFSPADLKAFIIPTIAKEISETKETVEKVINKMRGQPTETNPLTEEKYRYQEFRAFTNKVKVKKETKKDFLIETVQGSRYEIPLLKNLIIVKKLREIRVQTGFSRIRPSMTHGEDGQEIPVDERIEQVNLGDKNTRWFPGDEMRGEGLFLEFDFDAVSEHIRKYNLDSHLKTLMERGGYHSVYLEAFGGVSARLIALHSLSHALIQQLSFECGYSSSALREKIYCSGDKSSNKMAGILIYTAASDSEGTLGGLIKQGEPSLFNQTFKMAMYKMESCSSDPLCRESKGQGYLSLALAACHACLMLPETSCELFNGYLDRTTIVGSYDKPEMGLFNQQQ